MLPIDYDYRRARRERRLRWCALAVAVLTATIIVLVNVCDMFSPTGWIASSSAAHISILSAAALGTLLAGVLSAGVFWSHSIGLLPWLLMFFIHATGMLLSVQTGGGKLDRRLAPEVILLAVVLGIVLLSRGATLLRDAERMPNWLVARRGDSRSVPRLWVFVLCWLSPLAWTMGALNLQGILFESARSYSEAAVSAGQSALLIVCFITITARAALGFVVLERNRHSNWRRESTQGLGLAMALCAFVALYSFVYVAAQIQLSASAFGLEQEAQLAEKELLALRPPTLPANENANTFYKLANASLVAVDWEWMEKNWASPAAENESGRNLTALSYMRQGAGMKAADFGVDWSSRRRWTHNTSADCLNACRIEARQLARHERWDVANEDFSACLAYSRHFLNDPFANPLGDTLTCERKTLATIWAAYFSSISIASDRDLASAEQILEEHLKGRKNAARASCYAMGLAWVIDKHTSTRREFPGTGTLFSVLWTRSDWQARFGSNLNEEELTALKLQAHQTLDYAGLLELFTQGPARRLESFKLFGAAVRADLENVTRYRLGQAALGILRYKRYFGTWPQKLQDCVPQYLSEVPPDPFKHGEFIHYENSPPRVYSIGEAATYYPEEHAYNPLDMNERLELDAVNSKRGNIVLFLGN